MKIRVPSKPQGSTLILCVFFTAIIGITLASYLNLTASQNQAVMRSLAWNSTLPVLEAGIEEALTHLYHTDGTNLASNGWYYDDNRYYKWRAVGDGWTYVTISNSSPPVIYARGFIRAPLQSSKWLSRSVRVETKKDGLFSRGLVAKGQITLNGNNVLVDSFDSADPDHSSNGVYVVSRRKDNGSVATNARITNALATGNANIYGKVATGPGGSVSIGPNGAVGNLAWQASGTGGIQSGFSSDDMNVSFPDVQPPFSGGSFSPTVGVGYQYVIPSSGRYEVSALNGGLLVKSNAHAILLVTGNINFTGSDKIEIEPGGSLQLYVAGSDAKIGGNGVVNRNGNATNFFYWGLPSNTSLSINGNGTFTGVIYAPSADFTLNGSGTGEDVTGASVTSTAKLNGNFQFHYDENLDRINRNRGYIVTSWNEY